MSRQLFFQAARPFAPNRSFTQEMVEALDHVADLFNLPRIETGSLRPSKACFDLIKKFEGCRLEAYPDPGTGGVPWTIGFGSTRDENGQPIKPGTRWTQQQADAQLERDVARFSAKVAELVKDVPTTQAQFDAMTSLSYNIGSGAFEGSTLLKMHRSADYNGAAGQFGRWTKAAGKELKGLVRRREAEMRLYKGLPA